MNVDDLKKLTTASLNELAALLEQGRSERLIALLKTMGRFHRYSLHNVCLIVAQRPSATRVAGFHTWRSVGRFVRKGEKGIAILAPIVRRRREETQEDEPRVLVGFRPRTSSTSSKPTARHCRRPRTSLAILASSRPLLNERLRRTASASSTPKTWEGRSDCRAEDVSEC
jgi:hypothetical protein